MGWEEIDTHTKSCGCSYTTESHDSFNSYRVISYTCEACRLIIKEEHEENNKQYNMHIDNVLSVEHKTFTQLKNAIDKFRAQRGIDNSDRWIQKLLQERYTTALLIQKVQNKWMCSQERLDVIDFKKRKY